MLHETQNKISLHVKIIPKANKNEIVDFENNLIKIKIKEIPDKGKANKELIFFLSKIFKISKSNIKIMKGKKTKNKIIQITNISIEKANKCLNINN